MTVIKITVIHSKGYNQITMGIETLRNIVIITTDIFAVQNEEILQQQTSKSPKTHSKQTSPEKDQQTLCEFTNPKNIFPEGGIFGTK